VRKRLDWVLVALLGVSACLNVYLVTSRATPAAPGKVARTSPPPLEVGATLPPLSGKRLDGTAVTIDYSGAVPTVIYHWSPSCLWCQRNAENIKTLTAAIAGRYRVVAVAAGPVSDAEAIKLGLSPAIVIANVSTSFLRSAHLNVTPETIVVGDDGKVTRVWTGAFSGTGRAEVEEFFSVTLPGSPE
jgi:hypothetical protein